MNRRKIIQLFKFDEVEPTVEFDTATEMGTYILDNNLKIVDIQETEVAHEIRYNL